MQSFIYQCIYGKGGRRDLMIKDLQRMVSQECCKFILVWLAKEIHN